MDLRTPAPSTQLSEISPQEIRRFVRQAEIARAEAQAQILRSLGRGILSLFASRRPAKPDQAFDPLKAQPRYS